MTKVQFTLKEGNRDKVRQAKALHRLIYEDPIDPRKFDTVDMLKFHRLICELKDAGYTIIENHTLKILTPKSNGNSKVRN